MFPSSPQSLYSVRSVTAGHLSSDLDFHELELMHHYQELVCCTLSRQPPIQQTWQSVIPKEATAHSGLMHALLALAALHHSHLGSNGYGRFRSAAIRHQNLSISYLRSLINNASPENCNALFALSTSVVVFVFALPQSPIAPTDFDPFQEMIRLVELVKGACAVVKMTREWVSQGPLRPLLFPGAWDVRLVVADEIGNALKCLILCNDTFVQSEPERATYGTAIKMLRQTFEMLALNPDDQCLSLLWVALMEREYIDLLRAEEPMALVLLAHFGVALHVSRRNWWSGNWGYQIVKAVHDMLDGHWHPRIQWPMVSVGLWNHTATADTCVPPSSAFQHLFDGPKIPPHQTNISQPMRFSCDPIVMPGTEKLSLKPEWLC
jgi:hypothetical protein